MICLSLARRSDAEILTVGVSSVYKGDGEAVMRDYRGIVVYDDIICGCILFRSRVGGSDHTLNVVTRCNARR